MEIKGLRTVGTGLAGADEVGMGFPEGKALHLMMRASKSRKKDGRAKL